MKSNKVKLIVIVVILVAALAVLFTIYSRQAADRNDLNDKLDRARILFTGLGAQKEALQDDLAQAQSSLNTSLAEFPRVVESIEYGDDLFEIAADCNVQITSLSGSVPADKKVGGVTYSVSSFGLTVSGTTENMLKFIYAIRTGDDFQLPWAADVKSVNMDAAKSTINLDIYGYKGT
jgi:type IV secretory pathway VirB6-like protein